MKKMTAQFQHYKMGSASASR